MVQHFPTRMKRLQSTFRLVKPDKKARELINIGCSKDGLL